MCNKIFPCKTWDKTPKKIIWKLITNISKFNQIHMIKMKTKIRLTFINIYNIAFKYVYLLGVSILLTKKLTSTLMAVIGSIHEHLTCLLRLIVIAALPTCLEQLHLVGNRKLIMTRDSRILRPTLCSYCVVCEGVL